MRRLYVTLLFILFLIPPCLSQKTADSAIKINKIPKNGLLLNKGWKFHGGDNPEWAKFGFDDGNWDPIDPAKDIHELPEVRKAGIGWFRLKLNADSSLFNKQLALIVSQVVASEIYLDGRLIYSLGNVNADYKKESTLKLIDRPFSFKVDAQAAQMLAVRYSFNPKNYYLNYLVPNTCLKLRLTEANEGFTDYIIYTRFVTFQDTVQIALYFILCVMSLFLYFSIRRQVAYLYISFFCLAELIQSVVHIPINSASFTCSTISACMFFSYIFAATGALFICNAIYKLYELPKTRLYYFSVFYALLCIPVFIFFYRISGAFALSFFVVISFENCRALFKAHQNGGSGAGILLISTSTFLVLFLIIIPVYLNGNLQLAFLISVVAVTITLIFLSIFVAGEFARTWRLLQTRVTEVEQLSQKTIAQEQEKQQILTSQNETLETQVAKRTTELKKSLQKLKSAQSQLVQSEKMASLGELTAGIAHEIQNPLNFVNNFSEVNRDMIGELEEKLKNESNDEILKLVADIKQNEEKINQHGKRADFIVKGMLQHSRTGKSERQLTNINVLTATFFKLSYDGLRTKDKSFNAEMITNLDKNLPQINVIQQDIGRVMLNIFNNAFYAVNQKLKTAGEGYKPEVWLTTSQGNNYVTIKVKDNGIGIPDAIKNKIMQPFFTTKPAGEGTGLGLSLSYDMVVKGHGGKIEVGSKEGEYTTFTISLPINIK